MMLLDHPIISERYFFPRMNSPAADYRLDVEVDGATLACAWYDHGHRKTIVHFHGNGEVVADWESELAPLVDGIGANIFFAEYRGYGASSGTPLLGTMLDDVLPIARAAGRDEDLIAFGRSVGSIYAIELVSRLPGVAALVLESGIADVRQRLALRVTPGELGVSPEVFDNACAERLDHKRKLAAYEGPLLLMHAQADYLVEVEHALANADAAGGEVTRVIFDCGDHNSIFAANRREYVERLADFVRAAA